MGLEPRSRRVDERSNVTRQIGTLQPFKAVNRVVEGTERPIVSRRKARFLAYDLSWSLGLGGIVPRELNDSFLVFHRPALGRRRLSRK